MCYISQMEKALELSLSKYDTNSNILQDPGVLTWLHTAVTWGDSTNYWCLCPTHGYPDLIVLQCVLVIRIFNTSQNFNLATLGECLEDYA